MNSSVRNAPTSTTNITGFAHWMSGRSMTNDCLRAGTTSSGASSAARRVRRGRRTCSRDGIGSGDCERKGTAISGYLRVRRTRSSAERNRAEVLGERSEGSDRQEQQRPDDHDRPEHEETEGGGVVAHGAEGERTALLAAQTRRHRDRRNDRNVTTEEHHEARRDVPRPARRGGGGVVVEAPGVPEALEARAVVRRGRR